MAYVVDVMLLARSRRENLIGAAKKMDLEIDEEKIKFMQLENYAKDKGNKKQNFIIQAKWKCKIEFKEVAH